MFIQQAKEENVKMLVFEMTVKMLVSRERFPPTTLNNQLLVFGRNKIILSLYFN